MGLLRGAERRGTPADLLVLGLGNPGAEYVGTRHNLGVEVVEELARRGGAQLKRSKEKALTAEVTLAGKRFALAFPQTYMNLSGESAILLAKRHGVDDPTHVVVVHDELDLPVGTFKLKLGGGLAGHNGLKSLKQHLHTDGFARVRIGVGRPPGTQSGADYVLRRPGKAERTEFDIVVQEAADAVECIAADGIAVAMNRFNGKPA
jgi:peptidyl-tRNA hydrolase, PTH1 family